MNVALKVTREEIKNFDYFRDLEHRFIEIRGPNQMYWRQKSDLEKFMPKDRETLLFLLRSMMITRMAEEKIERIAGQVPGSAFFGKGNEATSCGIAAALNYDDLPFPLHRDAGCDFVRGVEAFKRGDIKVPLIKLFFAQYLSKANSPCRGKDGNIHWGIPEMNRPPMISPLGTNIPVSVGAAFFEKLRKSGRIVYGFIGDGATQTGDFQGLNQAVAWNCPLITFIDNNQWSFRTTLQEQTAAIPLSRKAEAFGMRAFTIDGTDILAVYALTKIARKIALSGNPVLIESVTFRLAGHSVYDSYKEYVPAGDLEKWQKKRDPISGFQNHLKETGVVSEKEIEALADEIEKEIDEALEWAKNSPDPKPQDLYADVAANPELQKFIEILCGRAEK